MEQKVTVIKEGALKVKGNAIITDAQKAEILNSIECVDINHVAWIDEEEFLHIKIDLKKRIDSLSLSGESYRIEHIPWTGIGNGVRIAVSVSRTFKSFIAGIKQTVRKRLNMVQ